MPPPALSRPLPSTPPFSPGKVNLPAEVGRRARSLIPNITGDRKSSRLVRLGQHRSLPGFQFHPTLGATSTLPPILVETSLLKRMEAMMSVVSGWTMEAKQPPLQFPVLKEGAEDLDYWIWERNFEFVRER